MGCKNFVQILIPLNELDTILMFMDSSYTTTLTSNGDALLRRLVMNRSNRYSIATVRTLLLRLFLNRRNRPLIAMGRIPITTVVYKPSQ